jgi:glycerol uptake facilitator-like aquaporin
MQEGRKLAGEAIGTFWLVPDGHFNSAVTIGLWVSKRFPTKNVLHYVAIAIAITLIHLISIPVTNTSVDPARSTGPAVVQGGWALGQLWMFWVAPIVGAVIAGLAWRFISPSDSVVDGEAAGAKVA